MTTTVTEIIIPLKSYQGHIVVLILQLVLDVHRFIFDILKSFMNISNQVTFAVLLEIQTLTWLDSSSSLSLA